MLIQPVQLKRKFLSLKAFLSLFKPFLVSLVVKKAQSISCLTSILPLIYPRISRQNFWGVKMIPTIGIMVGCYIFTRMLDLIIGGREGKASIVTILFVVIIVVITIYGMYDLFTSGLDISDLNF